MFFKVRVKFDVAFCDALGVHTGRRELSMVLLWFRHSGSGLRLSH